MSRRSAFAVALIGPDGAGKTTIARRLPGVLPMPATYIYMGVNLEASRLMLPTTRLALAMKRRRGQRGDMQATSDQRRDTAAGRGGAIGGAVRAVRRTARLANWTLEEWYRQLVAWRALRRGRVVIFDRHFLADYHATDIAATSRDGRPLLGRIHGLLLERVYPRPDLVICLDAPAEVLWGRKAEGTLEYLEQRRRDYLAVRDLVEHFVVLDASRPLDEVIRGAADAIRSTARERANGGTAAPR